MIFAPRQLDIFSKLLATFVHFPVLSLRVCPCAIKVFSTFGAAHVRKHTRLSPPAQLQCLHSGAEEPGNEASPQFKR